MSGLSEHVIETFGITQAIVDAIGGVDAATYRAITDVFIERQHEQVVRCRDCKHFAVDQSDHEYRSGWWCKWWNTDIARPDTFCACGRRANG